LALCIATIASSALAAQPARAPIDTTWRQGGVCYEIFVRSFFDSDGDGIGDLAGLTQKLDYVNDGDPRSTRSLGADASGSCRSPRRQATTDTTSRTTTG
jgi:hypothetical protein